MKLSLSLWLHGVSLLSSCTPSNAIPFHPSKISSLLPFQRHLLNQKNHSNNEYPHSILLNQIRGGEEAALEESVVSPTPSMEESSTQEEDNLEDRVYAAMRKLGISVDDESKNDSSDENGSVECKDGVCTIPSVSSTSTTPPQKKPENQEDIQTMTKRIAKDMDVDESIVYAAIGATVTQIGEEDEHDVIYNEDAAREMIQNEVDAIQRVMEDCEEVSFFSNKK